jgi:hypothetical protein
MWSNSASVMMPASSAAWRRSARVRLRQLSVLAGLAHLRLDRVGLDHRLERELEAPDHVVLLARNVSARR